jgi:cardiolipin synthase
MASKRNSRQRKQLSWRGLGEGLADQAIFRTAGAEKIGGNQIRLLRDAAENYPAWIEAIESAERWIHFETYIIHDDEAGQHFAHLLSAKAQAGVKVRLIYDWVGALGNARRRFWKRLAQNGIDVRCFNPPRLDSPLGWISRDHRKTIVVDGKVAHVSGLCVGQRWIGYPARGIEPWRDTGVEIRGPAIVDIERAFADAWAATGDALDPDEIPEAVAPAGDVSLRVVATVPSTGGVYRLDQLITALAHRSIWLSDAYFAGTSPYVHALRSAARSGVDVRMLIPGASDVPVARAVARAGLRPLLEAGIRVFEWNGSMMHAKTAVVDGHWARVGSTNLNLTSWLGNWELDVVVEDDGFARQMEAMFLDDLSHSTEIVLKKRRRRSAQPGSERRTRRRRSGAAGQAATGMIRLGHSVGAAITRQRELGPAESVIMLWGAAALLAVAVVAVLWPRFVALPLAIVCVWVTSSLLIQALRLRFRKSLSQRERVARQPEGRERRVRGP